MSRLPSGAACVSFNGVSIVRGVAPGRIFQIDARCVEGAPVRGAYVHVCALTDPGAAVAFDQPEIQQVRRDALAWWIGELADALVCVSTLALDEARYGGAVTVTRKPVRFADDPFARIYRGSVLRSDIFCAVPPPGGPLVERRAGVAWPGGRFPDARRGRTGPDLTDPSCASRAVREP